MLSLQKNLCTIIYIVTLSDYKYASLKSFEKRDLALKTIRPSLSVIVNVQPATATIQTVKTATRTGSGSLKKKEMLDKLIAESQ